MLGKLRNVNMMLSCLLLLSAFAVAGPAGETSADGLSGVSFYIAPNGNDEQSGTKEAPFATLERAREAVRSMKHNEGLPDGGVNVYLRGGIYPMSSTFTLDEEDSGTASSPIVYRSYEDEKVDLVGGEYLAA